VEQGIANSHAQELRARDFTHHRVLYRLVERAGSRESRALLGCAPFPLDPQVRRRRHFLRDRLAGPLLAGQNLVRHGGPDGHVLDKVADRPAFARSWKMPLLCAHHLETPPNLPMGTIEGSEVH
jgi:hypothetical protein